MRTNDFGAAPTTAVALSLDQLPDNQWATVLDVARPDSADDRDLVLRLTEIGFVPGEAVRIASRRMRVSGLSRLTSRLRMRSFISGSTASR